MLVKAGPGAIPVEKSNNEDSVDSSVSNQRHQRPLGPAAIPSLLSSSTKLSHPPLPARRGPAISFLTERQMSSLLKSLDTLTAYVIGVLIVWI